MRVAIAASALGLLAWLFHGVDLTRVAHGVVSIGAFGLVLIATPQLVSSVSECLGLRRVFSNLGQPISIWALLRVRSSTEALAQTLPLGVLWAESLKPVLLDRHAGVPCDKALAAIVIRKYLLIASQSLYVGFLSACGFATLARLSASLLGTAHFAWLALGISAALALLAFGVRGAFTNGRVVKRVVALVRRVRNHRTRRVAARQDACIGATDDLTSHYFGLGFRRSTLLPGCFFLVGWSCEALETYVVLRLLGVELEFFSVASVEVMLSFLKNVLFVVPAGIGVQDIGYVSCLAALGVPDALTVGATFSAIKRGKQLLGAGFGYALLASSSARPQNDVCTA